MRRRKRATVGFLLFATAPPTTAEIHPRKPSLGSTRRGSHTRARPGFMLAAALRRLSQAQSSTSLGAGAAIFANATRASAFAPTHPPAGSDAAARASRIVASRALLRPHRRRVHATSASAAWTRTDEGFARVDDPRASPADRAPRAPRAVSGRRPDRSAPAPRRASAPAPPRAMGRKGGKAAALPDDASNGKGPGSRAYVQVIGLGTDTDGDTSPSVLLFTDNRRYVWNVGEGFQRFAVEHGVNLRRLSHVFFTRVCGHTSGGLTGMLLTMADGVTEHREDEPELHVHGPPRVQRLMGTIPRTRVPPARRKVVVVVVVVFRLSNPSRSAFVGFSWNVSRRFARARIALGAGECQ